jgi:hypothetical protein
MDGAKPAAATAGVKQGLEEALLQIVQKHHHQSLRQRQQTGTPPVPPRYFFLNIYTTTGTIALLHFIESRQESSRFGAF